MALNVGQMARLQNMSDPHSRLEGRLVRITARNRGLYLVQPFAKLSGDEGDSWEVEEAQLAPVN